MQSGGLLAIDIERRPFTERELHRMVALFHEGALYSEISEFLGRSKKTIEKKLSAIGLRRRGSGTTILTCTQCSKKFERYKSAAKKAERHFCSKECQLRHYAGNQNPKWRGGKQGAECVQCGQPFDTYDKTQKFCSPKCKAASQRGPHPERCKSVERTCLTCGITFSVRPSDPKLCCTKRCSGIFRRKYPAAIAADKSSKRRRLITRDIRTAFGSHSEEEWQEVLRRAKGRCAHCKKRRKLTKDHVTPLAEGGTDLISNIQPLCLSCNCRKAANRWYLL